MIPSPKERFLADAALAKQHADLVASSRFIVALDAAMLEYAIQCSRVNPPSDGGLLLRGARQFVFVFCELANPQTKPTTVDRDNL